MINLIWDTETTGLAKHPLARDNVQPRIIEWAGILVDEKGNKLDEYVQMINPGIEIENVITDITGITNEMLIGKPTFKEVYEPILAFMKRAHQIIAHNLPFDWTMLTLELDRINVPHPQFELMLCTVQEHIHQYGYRPKLTILYEQYMGKPLHQTHRALDDVEALAEICREAGVLI